MIIKLECECHITSITAVINTDTQLLTYTTLSHSIHTRTVNVLTLTLRRLAETLQYLLVLFTLVIISQHSG